MDALRSPLTVPTARRRVARGLLALALLFHLSLLASWRLGFWNPFTFDSVATQGHRGWDFFALYQAGHNVLTGVSAYESANHAVEVVVPRYTPFRYLPVSAYTVGVVLNALPPLWAFRLWVLVSEALLLGCAALSWWVAPDRRRGAVMAAMWLCFTPYYLELYLGQFNVVQTALVLLMMVAVAEGPLLPVPRPRVLRRWRRGERGGRDALFGGAWVASLLWKQNTGLFVPLLLRQRRWRLLGVAALVVLVTSGPYFALQPGALQAFLGNLSSGAPAPNLGNLGVRQFLYSLVSALTPGLSPDVHLWLQRAWVALVVGINLALTLRDRRPPTLLHLCLWTSSYLLIYHHVWEHHYLLALPVLVMFYRCNGSPGVLMLWALLAVWTPYVLIDPRGMAGVHAPMRWTPLSPPLLDVLYHGSKALPAVALWAYVVSTILRRPRTEAP
ncbi:MAG TPA: DUF2029 domain-containing protein [Chloroflexi bacterium]|jgi:hypothetical protein|nr:DUF2029 domain-containing protein [Chloroflexota bacterium]